MEAERMADPGKAACQKQGKDCADTIPPVTGNYKNRFLFYVNKQHPVPAYVIMSFLSVTIQA
jgi:hypothetical protein